MHPCRIPGERPSARFCYSWRLGSCSVGWGPADGTHRHPHAAVPPSAQPSTTSSQTSERSFVANIKSQIKRIRTNEKARQRNQSVKSELKTYVRRVRVAVEAGDQDAAESALKDASRKLDKAVSKGVIHKNQAANRKRKLAKTVNQMGETVEA